MSKSKKMMKRSLALGALMAFVITGQAWAQKIENGTIEKSNRYTALGYTESGSLNLRADEVNKLENNTTNNGNSGFRNYGLTLSDTNNTTKTLTITAGEGSVLDIDVNLDGTFSNDTRAMGIRNNYRGTMKMNGGTLDVNVTGTNNKMTMGIANYHVANFNTDKTIVNVSGDRGWVYGITSEKDKINNVFDDDFSKGDITINNLDATVKALSGRNDIQGIVDKKVIDSVRGVNVNYGNATFTGKYTTIKVENYANGYGQVIGVMTQGDPGYPNATMNFNAEETKITVTNYATGIEDGTDGVVGSGPYGINFNGDSVVIEVDGGKEVATGIIAQYSAKVKSSIDTNLEIKVETEGKAYGVLGQEAHGSAGNVELGGNAKITATGYSAYGIEAEDGSKVEVGNEKAIVSVVATGNGTGADGEAIAVSANGAGSQVDINAGTLTVSATSSNAKHPGSSLQAKDGAVVNVTANKATINGMMYAGAGATLDISGIKELVLTGLTKDSDAAIQVEGGTLKVNNTETGTLAIEGAEAGNTYKVVSGAGKETALWKDANLAYDRTTMVATSNHDTENKLYTVKYESFNDVTKVTDDIKEQFVEAVGGEEKLAVSNLVAEATGQGAIMEETAPGAKEFLAAVSSDVELKPEQKAAVINAAAQLAEAGGNAGTAASVASNVSNVTTGRMSFTGGAAKGGKGVGLLEEGSGAAVWTQYMHGKDEATDMPMDGGATSYESNYDGIVLGVDFKKVGKFQSGVAFNYGEGDSTGFTSAAKTKSDYDFWGIGYYGNIRNEDTNFIFDVNYAKSDSDVTQNNAGASAAIEASPETTTWSAGVKVEKLYQNNNVQIVPYTGLRYMSIDTDEYTSKLGGETLFNYAPERQDIWLLPLGVTIKQEVVNDNGWVVTPKVDLSYVWAFGDTDSNMSVSIPGIAASNDTLGFTVMDDGSFIGLVGIEATMDDWTFGVSYSYQKGDYAESKKWFVDAKYTF